MLENDFINELKELAFASRLRRLSDRLGRDVSKIYRDLQVPFEARWFTLFYLLSQHAPLSVTEAASRLGLSHAGVNLLAAQMEKAGLIQWRKSSTDERRRLLRLSASGQKQLKTLEPIWEKVRDETNELLKSVEPQFLILLQQVENSLDERNMYDRVIESLNVQVEKKIEILPYRPAFKKYFRSINEQWLKKYFGMESEDRRQLDDPNGQIIRKGGRILFAKVDGQVVGTCALISHNDGALELTKMGVSPKARRLGVGRKLAEETIRLARGFGVDKLYLLTAPELKAAIKLYHSLGFKRIITTPLSACKYERCTFAMELDL